MKEIENHNIERRDDANATLTRDVELTQIFVSQLKAIIKKKVIFVMQRIIINSPIMARFFFYFCCAIYAHFSILSLAWLYQ